MFTDRTFWVYPWDITDEDPHNRLADIRQLGATSISIPFSYHSLRALAPHRSGGKVINTTAAICFRPRSEEFPDSGIEPICSEWATDEGPVRDMFTLAGSLGLRLRAWTVVFHNTTLATKHPESSVTNCFGDVFVHALCPSAPKCRDYALQLIRAISRRPIHAIELEAVGFYGYEHLSHHDKCGIVFDLFHHFLFSCCFCSHCQRRFRLADLDPELICKTFRDRLIRFFNGQTPTLNRLEEADAELRKLVGEDAANALLRVRNQCVLGLLKDIRDTVPASIELTVSSGLSPFECGALLGAYPKDTLQIVDRLLLVVFQPDEVAFQKRFDDALKCFPDASRWIGGVRIFPPDAASESAIQSRLDFLREKGFSAINLYHYGLAPRHLLSAAGQVWNNT